MQKQVPRSDQIRMTLEGWQNNHLEGLRLCCTELPPQTALLVADSHRRSDLYYFSQWTWCSSLASTLFSTQRVALGAVAGLNSAYIYPSNASRMETQVGKEVKGRKDLPFPQRLPTAATRSPNSILNALLLYCSFCEEPVILTGSPISVFLFDFSSFKQPTKDVKPLLARGHSLSASASNSYLCLTSSIKTPKDRDQATEPRPSC